MSLASICEVSRGGDSENHCVGPWWLGNTTLASNIFENMSMPHKTEGDRMSQKSEYVLNRPSKVMRHTLPGSVQNQAGNLPVTQLSMTSEWICGTQENSPLEETGSDGVTLTTKSQQNHTDRDQKGHGSVQSFLCNEGSFQGQQPIHEDLKHSQGDSFQCSPSIQSCLSGGSPTSSQISQSFFCDSQCFHSPEDAFHPSKSRYRGDKKPAYLKHVLQKLETTLLGPDSYDPNNCEVVNEKLRIPEDSEWSLEALAGVTGLFYRNRQPISPKKETVQISMVTENRRQIVDNRHQSAKAGGVSGADLRVSTCSPGSISEKQTEVHKFKNPQDDVKPLLIICAKAIADRDMAKAGKLIGILKHAVSVCGNPIQRLGAYMVEGLVARLASSGGTIYKTLQCKAPASKELLSYVQILYEVCPYYKFGYLAANGALAEAFKHEEKVHIIDFQIAQGSQWVTLIQALATRPGGPPHVRITGLDDPVTEYAQVGGLQSVGQRLSKLAETCNVPFEFHALPMLGPEVQVDMLEVRTGEALAVNFAFQLHHIPDESVNTSNHRDRLLRMVKGMSPKVVTLVEQEANTNTAPFFPRFVEALGYYSAMFESLDVNLPRDSKDRVNVEQHCMARDIVNIIACEGAERVERHELQGKWRSRLTMAGFKPYPLSSYVNSIIKSLLESYSKNYSLSEKDGALYLGWLDRHLVVASAWQ